MKLASKIFRRTDWHVTSHFGWRRNPITGANSHHNGTDYGTNAERWEQYAIESGSILRTGFDSVNGNWIWVNYPRIGKKLFHSHLHSINVRQGQSVIEGTLLGTTGTTGQSTGIHLHLGMQDSNGNVWQDPHAYNYTDITEVETVRPTIGVYITNSVMRVRTGPGTNYSQKRVRNLTIDGRKNATSTNLDALAEYKIGTVFNANEIHAGQDSKTKWWAKTPSGYVCIVGENGKIYCRKR